MPISPSPDTRATRTGWRVFLHLRGLVYMHTQAASATAIAFVKELEAAVLAEKAAREKQLAEARERQGERQREADRQKAEPERAKAEQATVNNGYG
jgi:hypothetical protein